MPRGPRDDGGPAASGPPVIGVDIGGSAIKAALVDDTGTVVSERVVVPTPQPAMPDAVAQAVAGVCARFDGPSEPVIGVAIPAVVTHGVVRTAANIDDSWIGTDGLAEATFGAARGVDGIVLVVTLGTGIGSALFVDGHLGANTELGHLQVDGFDMCPWASAVAMIRDSLSWEEWAGRLQTYLSMAENVLWPDLFVIGGGICADIDRFGPLLHVRTPIVRAQLGNDSGVVGAALAVRAGR